MTELFWSCITILLALSANDYSYTIYTSIFDPANNKPHSPTSTRLNQDNLSNSVCVQEYVHTAKQLIYFRLLTEIKTSYWPHYIWKMMNPRQLY